MILINVLITALSAVHPAAPPAPANASIHVTPVQQATPYYCLVATSEMDLKSYKVNMTQSQIAASEGTSSGGTSGLAATSFLSEKTGQDFMMTSDQTASEISSDVSMLVTAGHPAIMVTDPGYLPWDHTQSNPGGHSILATAVHGSTVTVIDPWSATVHTISAARLAQAGTSIIGN